MKPVYIIVILSLAACSAPADPAAQASPPAPPPPPAAAEKAGPPKAMEAKVAARSPEPSDWKPAQFAEEWKAVRQTGDEQERAGKGAAMAARWDNKQVRWTGAVVAGLCAGARQACPINVFEKNATPDAWAVGGFFPRAAFDVAGWDVIKRGCAGQSECVVDFTADIAVASTDMDSPLRMSLTNPVVHSARAPAMGENWFARPKPKLGFGMDDKPPRDKGSLPTGAGAVPAAGLVRKATF